jgi:hypothetical protein
MNFLIALVIVLTIILALIAIFKDKITMWAEPMFQTEEVTTTTTTTVVHHGEPFPESAIAGTLIKYSDDSNQPYVIDPADKTRWNLTTNDDMYEDADGKIWKII